MLIFRGLPGVAVTVVPGVSVPGWRGMFMFEHTLGQERFSASGDEISGGGWQNQRFFGQCLEVYNGHTLGIQVDRAISTIRKVRHDSERKTNGEISSLDNL